MAGDPPPEAPWAAEIPEADGCGRVREGLRAGDLTVGTGAATVAGTGCTAGQASCSLIVGGI